MIAMQNRRLLDLALNLGVIDLQQFNDGMDVWSKNRSKDAGFILLEKGFITKAEYDDLLAKIGETLEVSFEHYSIEGIVGRGGAGRVYLARDERIGRRVAIKEISPTKLAQDPRKAEARFLREAKISGRLDHPGIVPIYELSQKEDGSYFYVMKYVKGKTFSELVEQCKAKTAEEFFSRRLSLLDKFISVAEAIGFAHSKGVIHRDLKPGNIIVGAFGEVVILDWGLAKSLSDTGDDVSRSEPVEYADDEDDDAITRAGAKVGTPSFMSPEQIDRSYGEVDTRSDVYSLGILLFMLLTGTKPYSGKPEEVMKMIAGDSSSPSPADYCKLIPPELAAICKKAMAKKKESRFRDAWELANELKDFRSGKLVSIYSYSKSELFRRFISRNKAAVIATLLVMCAIVTGAGFSTYYAIDAHKERLLAERALVDVSGLSESAMKLSRKVVSDIGNRINSITEMLDGIAEDFGSIGFMQPASIKAQLTAASDEEGELLLYVMRPSEKNVSVVSNLPSSVTQVSKADYAALVSRFKLEGGVLKDLKLNERLKSYFLTIRIPIFGGKGIRAILSADISLDDLIAYSIGFDPKQSPYQVWLMNAEGDILYDENPDEIGRELFSDRMYANYPELQKFGQAMLAESWGVGHYNFLNPVGDDEYFKISAWDTMESIENDPWKVVITYPYKKK